MHNQVWVKIMIPSKESKKEREWYMYTSFALSRVIFLSFMIHMISFGAPYILKRNIRGQWWWILGANLSHTLCIDGEDIIMMGERGPIWLFCSKKVNCLSHLPFLIFNFLKTPTNPHIHQPFPSNSSTATL